MADHSPTPRSTGTPPVYYSSPTEERSKPRIAAMERGPGPARYKLPGSTGANNHDPSKKKNPAYSFGIKTGTGFNSCSPGPVYHVSPSVTRKGKDGGPVYSLHARITATKKYIGPGPAAYHVGNINPPRESKLPAYSFGRRVRFSKVRAGIPSPNKYSLPSLVGSNVYSFTGRSEVGSFQEDFRKTPGPGTYSRINPHVYRQTGPAYSLHDRCSLPFDKTKKPGPGTHNPEKVVCDRRQAPAFSFGVRHSEYMASCLDTLVE